MKNIIYFIIAIFLSITLSSCLGDDEDTTADCYTCVETQTEYCYTAGNSFYSVTFGGETIEQELAGRSWSSYKVGFFAICENGGITTDCYTCNFTNTTYCYTTGDIEYSITVNDDEPTYESIAVGEWEITKRASLENDCVTGLPGAWNLVDYTGTAKTETTVDGTTDPAIITTSTLQGTDYGYVTIFMANPNKVFYDGGLAIHIVSTTAGVDTETDINTPYADPSIKKMWRLDADNLTIENDDFDEYKNTITQINETTLKIRTETKITIMQSGFTHVVTDDVVTTYERQ